MPDLPRISDAEWEVMEVLWAESPLAASDVVQAVPDHKDWSPRTVKTLLNRLVTKGALRYDVEGKRYLYRPAITRSQCVRKESQSFAQRVFGGQPAPVLVHLVRNAKLSRREIEELRRILRDKQKG